MSATSLPETTTASPITPEFTSFETEIDATTPITPELTPSKTIPPSENMPQQTQNMLQQTQAVPLLETGGDLNIPNQPALRVYSRKQNSQGNKLPMNSMHCPESELVLGTNSSSSGNPENIFETLDVPITHRKGVRSCTKHPISKSVSYDNLSPSFHAFTTNLSSVNIPRSVKEAFDVPEWKSSP